MNWLHLCDFHTGGPRAPQKNALASLVETIHSICEKSGKVVDAVFLVGDLAYSGRPDEYNRFRDDFYLPLMSNFSLAGASVFAVPGNHDVNCDIGVPVTWDILSSRKQDIFFAEDEDGKRIRKQRSEVFQAYCEFVEAHNIYSPDPRVEVSKLYNLPNLPVNILATNTAFFSDESENKRPKSIPVPLTSLRQFIKNEPFSKPLLVLGHHSPQSFITEHFKLFKALLTEKRASFFHGHEHDPSIVFNADGSLRTLGFGATYLQSLESQPYGSYVNSFTFCTLTDKLSLTSFSWERGSWRDTTTIQYPDCEIGGNSPFEQVTILMPSKEDYKVGTQPPTLPIAKISRSHPQLSSIIPVGQLNEQLWMQILRMSENVEQVTQEGEPKTSFLPEKDGKLEATLEMGDKRHLVVCILGANHILSAKEVETINTRLDTEDYSSATVLSLGMLSDDARNMYLRLKTRKSIEILANTDLSANADRLMSSAQKRHIQNLDAAHASARLLVTEREIYCLITQETDLRQAFYLLNADGVVMGADQPIVTALRSGNESFAKAIYLGELSPSTQQSPPSFDEHSFLRRSFEEYNKTKYAALASIGFRFSDLPLKELYVSATACEITQDRNSRVEAIVEDHLAQFPASEALKNHIRRELLSSLTQDVHQETSDAREFCQQYSAVLVTGDPGSGKTCFVKNEILAYCERAETQPKLIKSHTWHSVHVPIMLQLSEVVSEYDLEAVGLFAVAARLLQRKSLIFSADDLKLYASQGRLAFFFDGLDEVVSIERRALVVKHINDFITGYLAFGNRVVVTSRPAAVHIVNLLPSFHRLELQGLSQSDIRILATRVLTLKVVDSPEGALLDVERTGDRDTALVDRLIFDCSANPGVARLAQNPLLLTLLVLIYANSGALSAKRHVIYEEAIKTLSSVRGREAGHVPISAQDLRERLGAIALSVYRKESGLLPTRSEVRLLIQSVMAKQRLEVVTLNEADEFLQKVAESTGLITIGGKDDNSEDAVVTFMHHSFLEYFAAIGLSLDLQNIRIGELVYEPRWREILTLLSGIVGENADIAPILLTFLQSTTANDVEAKMLLFSMDCALESEIPSESAQRLIAKALVDSVKTGAAKTDPWVRAEIGHRLAALFESCGTTTFTDALVPLITSGSGDESAAAIQIAGYACEKDDAPEQLVSALKLACEREEDSVIGALCWAAGHSRLLRSEKMLRVVSTNLLRSRKRRKASFDAIAKIPTLAAKHWPQIINGLDDDDSSVKKSASVAAVQAGIDADVIAMSADKKDILLRALRLYEGSGAHEGNRAKIKKDTIERLMDSPERSNRLIAIGLLPMIDDSETYVFSRLSELLTESKDREELVAVMDALRHSMSSLHLITANDLKLIGSWTQDGTHDVRLAALQVLGYFAGDPNVINSLLQLAPDDMPTDEYSAYMIALSNGRVAKKRIYEFIAIELNKLLDPNMRITRINLTKLGTCLEAVRRLEENASDRIVNRVNELANDFNADSLVKKPAILALPAITTPSTRSVDKLTIMLERALPEFENEVVQIPSILAKKCRQSVDYVIACVPALTKMRASAVQLHKKIASRTVTNENEFKVTELRSGIADISNIIVTFSEFIER